MSIFEYVDPTTAELEHLFFSLVPVVAEQAGVTQADAIYHLRRVWAEKLKSFRTYEAIDFRDDGRAATWRVRLSVWGGADYSSCLADTDDGKPLDHEGSTLMHGLAAVAAWVRELVPQVHPGCTIEGLSEATLASKIKSLRVALSNQGGASIWRLRYSVTAAAPPEEIPGAGGNLLKTARSRAPQLQHFMAHVRVAREESPRHKK